MLNRRKRIGVLMGTAIAPYIKNIMRGMSQAANDLGVDLVMFAGAQLAYNFLDGGKLEKSPDILNEIIREHVAKNGIDGLVIIYGAHTVLMKEDEKARFLDRYDDVPYILLEEFSDRDKTGYIINDNYNSMRKVVEHLVSYHGYTKFLFVGGWPDNRESIERQRAVEDVLSENDIEFNERMMVYGHFNEECDKEIEELLDRNDKPDAIVCANDFMAYSVYRVLKKRGFDIGNPHTNANAIAVTGYDDDIRAVSSDPPLTTVLQDFYYEGYLAIENILALLRDGIIDGGIIPTILQKRASCGCIFGSQHRYLPMNETERMQPEFYAIKVAELMREDILISNVIDEVSDKIYDLLYEAIYKDTLIAGGYIKDTLNGEVIVGQLRKIISSPYSRYISPYALMSAFSDYMSALIHASDDHNTMVGLSDMMVEGMKYLQNHILNLANVQAIQHEIEALQLVLIARNMSFVSDNGQEMFKVALEKMDFSDKSDIYIFLYDEPVSINSGAEGIRNTGMRLAARKTKKDGVVTYALDDMPVVTDELNVLSFASEYSDDKSSRYCITEIHHEDMIYGIAVSHMDGFDVMYLTLLALQVALILSVKH
ncbi:MAG: LacI family DNA-binding transcriptional regulator [Lachnospiraceae bacterium]|nr:LacI family DNA-binding transcriptional regulator [Lachnospiraceae bacterium]MBR5766962.1 LacI family DNA-binding transcriptional regulator [Lachnospiraceae bacterium]MBR6470015.1 LacI family DNA-binding transcriptional regulator [Lachnospiraceae bacterium]